MKLTEPQVLYYNLDKTFYLEKPNLDVYKILWLIFYRLNCNKTIPIIIFRFLYSNVYGFGKCILNKLLKSKLISNKTKKEYLKSVKK